MSERVTKLLIANRGEIAIRIAHTAADMGLPTVAVYSQDDARRLHLRAADESHALPGAGAAAYLNVEALIAVAGATGCDAIHPGYGFLAERADVARRCAEAGLRRDVQPSARGVDDAARGAALPERRHLQVRSVR